jgi:hypothetical protein
VRDYRPRFGFDNDVEPPSGEASENDWSPAPGRVTLTMGERALRRVPDPGKLVWTENRRPLRTLAPEPGKVPLTSGMTPRADLPHIYRHATDPAPLARDAGQRVRAARGAAGRPLPRTLAERLARAIGAPLEDVRVHTGADADAAASALRAEAFTVGRDIYFADGAYQPETERGQHLIAHEVAHAATQRGAPSLDDGFAVSAPGDAHEVAADGFADAFVRTPEAAPAAAAALSSGPDAVHRSPARTAAADPAGPVSEEPETQQAIAEGDPRVRAARTQRPPSPPGDRTVEAKAEPARTRASAPSAPSAPAPTEQPRATAERDDEPAVQADKAGDPGGRRSGAASAGNAARASAVAGRPRTASPTRTLGGGSGFTPPPIAPAAVPVTDEFGFAPPNLEKMLPPRTPYDTRQDRANAETIAIREYNSDRTYAAGQLRAFQASTNQQIASFGAVVGQIDGILNSAEASALAQVSSSARTQTAAVTASFAQASEQARAAGEALRQQIEVQAMAASLAMTLATLAARLKANTAHSNAMTIVDAAEAAQLGKLAGLYDAAKAKIRGAGTEAGDFAKSIAAQRAATYRAGRINRDDNIFDGPLTDKRCEAQAEAAEAVGKSYAEELTKSGEEQAAKLDAQRPSDEVAIRNIANSKRNELDKALCILHCNLDKASTQALADLQTTRGELLAQAATSLTETLTALDEARDAQLQAIDKVARDLETGIRAERAATAAALRTQVQRASDDLRSSQAAFLAGLRGKEVPERSQIDGAIAQSSQSITAKLEAHRQSVLAAAGTAAASMQQTGAAGQQSITEIGTAASASAAETATQVVEGFRQFGTATGEALTGFSTKYGEMMTEFASKGVAFLAEIGATISKAYELHGAEMQKGFERTYTAVRDALMTSVDGVARGGDPPTEQQAPPAAQGEEAECCPEHKPTERPKLTAPEAPASEAQQSGDSKTIHTVIDEEAKKARDKVQPRWKAWLMILITVIVSIIVAVVIGPMVVGAIAGFLGAFMAAGVASAVGAVVGGAIVGAATSAVLTLIDNGINGRNLLEGMGMAVLMGAIGGGIGGGMGALLAKPTTLLAGSVARGLGNAGRFAPRLANGTIEFASELGQELAGNTIGELIQARIEGRPPDLSWDWTDFATTVVVTAGAMAPRAQRISESITNSSNSAGANLGGNLGGSRGADVDASANVDTPPPAMDPPSLPPVAPAPPTVVKPPAGGDRGAPPRSADPGPGGKVPPPDAGGGKTPLPDAGGGKTPDKTPLPDAGGGKPDVDARPDTDGKPGADGKPDSKPGADGPDGAPRPDLGAAPRGGATPGMTPPAGGATPGGATPGNPPAADGDKAPPQTFNDQVSATLAVDWGVVQNIAVTGQPDAAGVKEPADAEMGKAFDDIVTEMSSLLGSELGPAIADVLARGPKAQAEGNAALGGMNALPPKRLPRPASEPDSVSVARNRLTAARGDLAVAQSAAQAARNGPARHGALQDLIAAYLKVKSAADLVDIVTRSEQAIIDNPRTPVGLDDQPALVFAAKGDPLAKAAQWLKPVSGKLDVIVHGTSDRFLVSRDGTFVEIGVDQMAAMIKEQGGAGRDIRLVACSTGKDASSIAQQLADKLGVKVDAPSDTVWITPDGRAVIGKNPFEATGSWSSFKPAAPMESDVAPSDAPKPGDTFSQQPQGNDVDAPVAAAPAPQAPPDAVDNLGQTDEYKAVFSGYDPDDLPIIYGDGTPAGSWILVTAHGGKYFATIAGLASLGPDTQLIQRNRPTTLREIATRYANGMTGNAPPSSPQFQQHYQDGINGAAAQILTNIGAADGAGYGAIEFRFARPQGTLYVTGLTPTQIAELGTRYRGVTITPVSDLGPYAQTASSLPYANERIGDNFVFAPARTPTAPQPHGGALDTFPSTDVNYSGGAKRQDRGQGQAAVFDGKSATDYAKSLQQQLGNTPYPMKDLEWLHIRASSLGGKNEKTNLVAGTSSANSAMIPYERAIALLSKKASKGAPIKVTWTTTVIPNTNLGMGMRIDVDPGTNTDPDVQRLAGRFPVEFDLRQDATYTKFDRDRVDENGGAGDSILKPRSNDDGANAPNSSIDLDVSSQDSVLDGSDTDLNDGMDGMDIDDAGPSTAGPSRPRGNGSDRFPPLSHAAGGTPSSTEQYAPTVEQYARLSQLNGQLDVHAVRPDGTCMFGALGAAVGMHPDDVRLTMMHMLEHDADLQAFLAQYSPYTPQQIWDVIANIETQWANPIADAVLPTFAAAFDGGITILSPDGSVQLINGGGIVLVRVTDPLEHYHVALPREQQPGQQDQQPQDRNAGRLPGFRGDDASSSLADPATRQAVFQTEIADRLGDIAPGATLQSLDASGVAVRLPGDVDVTIRVSTGPQTDPATLRGGGDDPYEITLSQHLADRQIARALAHELAEIQHLRTHGESPSDSVDPNDNRPHEMTAHYAGRLAELDVLLEDFAAASPDEQADLARDIDILVEAIGLRGEKASMRRDWMKPEMRSQLEAFEAENPAGSDLDSKALRNTFSDALRRDLRSAAPAVDPMLRNEKDVLTEGLNAAKLSYLQQSSVLADQVPGLAAQIPKPSELTDAVVKSFNETLLRSEEIKDSQAEEHWDQHEAQELASGNTRERYIENRHRAARYKAAGAWAQAANPIVALQNRLPAVGTLQDQIQSRGGLGFDGRLGYLLSVTDIGDILSRVGVDSKDDTRRAEGTGALAKRLIDVFGDIACHEDARLVCDLLSHRMHADGAKTSIKAPGEVTGVVDKIMSEVDSCPGNVKLVKLTVFSNHSILYVIGQDGAATRLESVAGSNGTNVLVNDVISGNVTTSPVAKQAILGGLSGLVNDQPDIVLDYEVHQAASAEAVDTRVKDQLRDKLAQLAVGMVVGSWDMADQYATEQALLEDGQTLHDLYGIDPVTRRDVLKVPQRSLDGGRLRFHAQRGPQQVDTLEVGTRYRLEVEGSWLYVEVQNIKTTGRPAWMYPMIEMKVHRVGNTVAQPQGNEGETIRQFALWSNSVKDFNLGALKNVDLTGRTFEARTGGGTYEVVHDPADGTFSRFVAMRFVAPTEDATAATPEVADDPVTDGPRGELTGDSMEAGNFPYTYAYEMRDGQAVATEDADDARFDAGTTIPIGARFVAQPGATTGVEVVGYDAGQVYYRDVTL